MCGVSVCLYAPTLDLGEGGRAQIPYLGMTLYYANTGIKKGLRKKSTPKLFSFSIIPPIHGLQNGIVSPAKGPKTLKHRKE